MNSKKAKSYNIGIIPPEKINNLAMQMSKEIGKKLASEFILDSKNFFPHITIYQAHVPLESLEELKMKLETFVSSSPRPVIRLNAFKVLYKTFVFWIVNKSRELYSLHKNIVNMINPLRKGLILPHLKSISGVSKDDGNDIEKYGSLLIGPRYNPHITITRLVNSNNSEKAIKILDNKESITFKAKDLILGDLGEHGTVRRIIERFKFKS